MNKIVKKLAGFLMMLMLVAVVTVPAYADTETADNGVVVSSEAEEGASTGDKALAAGLAIGLAATGGAIAMGMAISKSVEGIARQPEAENKIRTALMLGLVFVETAIIYALIVAILIIFVL